VLVGNSMGGLIAAETAIQHPRRVDKLVLVSAVGITAEHQRNERALAVHAPLRGRADVGVDPPSPRFLMRPRARHAMSCVRPSRAASGAPPGRAGQGSGKPGFIDALDALSDYPLRDRLERISVPTLIVWGDRDKLVPLPRRRRVRGADPETPARSSTTDTGHVPMLERPARFNADLESFLSE
jgi:pimeloyl-ACP methyl ester carboxylesterase